MKKSLNFKNEFTWLFVIYTSSRFIYYGMYFLLSIFNNDINFCQWDCNHYLNISLHGYQKTSREDWGYFPFFPLIITVLSTIFSISILLTGYILNNIVLFLSIYLLGKIFFTNKLSKERFTFYFLLSFSPATVYFTSFYTESLFLFLLSSFLFLLKKKRIKEAALITGVMLITRGNGNFVLVSILLANLNYLRKHNHSWKNVVQVLLFILTPFLFLTIYGQHKLGEPGFLFQGSSMFAALFEPNPKWILEGITLSSFTNLFNLLVVALALMSCIHLYRAKLFFEFWLLALITFVSSMTIFNFRYIFGIYPVYIFLSKFSLYKKGVLFTLVSIYLVIFLSLEYFWLVGKPFMV